MLGGDRHVLVAELERDVAELDSGGEELTREGVSQILRSPPSEESRALAPRVCRILWGVCMKRVQLEQ